MADGDILIVAAVTGELEALINKLAGATPARVGGRELLRGRICRQAVRLLTSGPGMANTVQGLTAAIEKDRPRLILQTGCGGGFNQTGIQIGDVAIASTEIDVQLGLEPTDYDAAVEVLPFPVINTNGQPIFNRYPVDMAESEKALQRLKVVLADSGMHIHHGPFITVATITATARRSELLYRQYGGLVENMEGAGAAHVAALYGIPFLEIRSVSNRVGERDKERWDLPLAFRRCSQAVKAYLLNA